MIGRSSEPLPHEERNQAHGGDDAKRENERRLEPIVLLAPVEHDLQGAHPEDEQRDADVVNPHACLPGRFQSTAGLRSDEAREEGSADRRAG